VVYYTYLIYIIIELLVSDPAIFKSAFKLIKNISEKLLILLLFRLLLDCYWMLFLTLFLWHNKIIINAHEHLFIFIYKNWKCI